jgi:hypothetical protein
MKEQSDFQVIVWTMPLIFLPFLRRTHIGHLKPVDLSPFTDDVIYV